MTDDSNSKLTFNASLAEELAVFKDNKNSEHLYHLARSLSDFYVLADFFPFFPLLSCQNAHVTQLRSASASLNRKRIIKNGPKNSKVRQASWRMNPAGSEKGSNKTDFQNDGDLLEDVHEDIKEPAMWRVIFHNDDYTPRDFVVEVLVSIFHKPPVEATRIMLEIHNRGSGVVGVYPYDIGSTKALQVERIAKDREFPLRVSLEEA